MALATIALLAMTSALGLLINRAVVLNDAVSNEFPFAMGTFGPFAPSRVNVLLLGYADETHDSSFLADSINVLSVDNSSNTTTMIPIPRDLWVEGIAEVPQNMKINEAFSIGYHADGIRNGAELTSQAISQVTGLDIHGYLALDFQGFRTMVDAIGGITVENPVAFEYTWLETDFMAGTFPYRFDAGTLRLDGDQALAYARNRYTSVPAESSDFARLVRQQRILQAIKAEVSGLSTLAKGLDLADALSDHLITNLSVLDLAMLAGKLEVDQRIELTEGVALQATTNTIGQYVLVPVGQRTSSDYESLRDYIDSSLRSSATNLEGGG